jgi:hypothetical protein
MNGYRVHRASARPELQGRWDGPVWGHVPVARIDRFHARSSAHRPLALVKLLHDDQTLYAHFRVDDAHVRSVHTAYESDTYKDSCVELFLQPAGGEAYFALEVNGGGAFSLRFIEDPTRTPNRFAKWSPVAEADARAIRIAHSLPAVVDPELAGPVTWWIEVAWPRSVMEPYCGVVGRFSGQRWRGNFFKCGDETSHPHWATWAPIGEQLNFHQPTYFDLIEFSADPAVRRPASREEP